MNFFLVFSSGSLGGKWLHDPPRYKDKVNIVSIMIMNIGSSLEC